MIIVVSNGARSGSGFTLLFEAMIMTLAKSMPVKTTKYEFRRRLHWPAPKVGKWLRVVFVAEANGIKSIGTEWSTLQNDGYLRHEFSIRILT